MYTLYNVLPSLTSKETPRGRRGRDRMVVEFTTTYVCNRCISPLTLWVRIPIRRGLLDTTLCNKVCQWLVTGRWFSPGTPVSPTNKTDRHDVTQILLKVVLNTITQTQNLTILQVFLIIICYSLLIQYRQDTE